MSAGCKVQPAPSTAHPFTRGHPSSPTPSPPPHTLRACAYEALAQYKDAQQDYAAALERDPASRDTLAGLNRCELQLGLAPTSAAAAKGRAAAGGRGGGAAPRSRVSDEEAKQLLELQNRIKDIKRQQYRAAEQRKGAELEKRRCDLTNSMLDQLPKDRRVYASVGRMYCLSSVDGERARVEEAKARSLDKLRLCGVTAEHLAQREKEEDAAFMEALEVIKRRK